MRTTEAKKLTGFSSLLGKQKGAARAAFGAKKVNFNIDQIFFNKKRFLSALTTTWNGSGSQMEYPILVL